jgi:DNA-binding transcriptional LysR family regulator
MENFRLKVFRTVADKRSFRHAAEALHLTQPAVSLQIKALEAEIGLQVVHRNGKGVVLTDAGARLLRYAEQIATISRAARQDLAQMKGPERNELKVGASTTIAQYVLPKLIGEFMRSERAVKASVLSGNTDKTAHDLLEGDVDIGLVEGPTWEPLLKAEPFLADEVVIIAAAGHRWANRTISVPQLLEVPLILRETGTGTRRVVEAALRDKGVTFKDLNVVSELDSTEAIKTSVEAGLGFGFVSRRAIYKELTLGTLKEVAVETLRFRRDFSILYPRGPELSGSAGTFLRFLRSVRARVAQSGEEKLLTAHKRCARTAKHTF